MQKNDTICCELFSINLSSKLSPISYNDRFREYSLRNFFISAGGVFVACPWCGKRLPHSLRDEYFNIIESLNLPGNIEPFFEVERLPKEFQSGEWWRNREL